MKNYNYIIVLFSINICAAQFIAIPDTNFEQALINQGIDNIMDGQISNIQAQ